MLLEQWERQTFDIHQADTNLLTSLGRPSYSRSHRIDLVYLHKFHLAAEGECFANKSCQKALLDFSKMPLKN
jgi:hypothetical protein